MYIKKYLINIDRKVDCYILDGQSIVVTIVAQQR